MKFEKIEFKNIFAYGEEVRTIEYSDNGELVLLKGKTGAGKSAILSLPILVLYGRLTKTTKTSIANRINKHGWIKGTIIKGQHRYIIEREFSPNSLKIWKDGEPVDIYGASAGEDYINTEIIEIPITTFTNMISISMKKFKSFLSMSPTERKQVVDEVFDIRIVNIVYDQIKKDARDLGNRINGDQSTLFSLNQTLVNANNEILKIQEKNATEENLKKMEENNLCIAEANRHICYFNKVYKDVYNRQNEVSKALYEKNKEYAEIKTKLKLANEKYNIFMKDRCPTCGTVLVGGDYDKIKIRIKEIIHEHSNKIVSLEEELKMLNEKSNKIQQACHIVQNTIYKFNLDINKRRSDNQLIDNKMKTSGEYQAVQNIIDNTQKQIEEIKASIDKNTKEINYLQKLLTVYSIEGVTKMIINNYIPLLNQELSENLIMLDFPYTLTFDDKFTPEIRDCGQIVPIETLSDGEETRVNLVILCSLYKLIKRKYSDVNLLTVDEVVSSIDPETSANVIGFLKNFADENNLNVFIVSHTDLPLDLFDKIINVEKKNGFSQFDILETVA